MSVNIYGASDDLIEIEGDVREEFYVGQVGDAEDTSYLAFSDGTVLLIAYVNPGIWRITPVIHGTASYEKTFEATSEDGDYTDRVTLHGGITWAVQGSAIARTMAKKEVSRG